jgi:glucosamine 6-phosphate synthetase-like amidotransferase/phosphosugar isomerase protein
MCGIMGYYSFGDTVPDKRKIEKMFVLLETRGRDASGFAFIDPVTNKLSVTKSPVPSSNLIKYPQWTTLDLPKIMIAHTRMKTQGEPSNNMNNHPLFTKDGLAIVHNGQIYNDKEVFTKKVKRDAQVDSEAILAVLAKSKRKEDPIKRIYDTLDGAFAVACIDQNDIEKLTLIKKENPIELYYNSEDDILYFASEKGIMQEALEIRPTLQRGFSLGERNYHYYEMEDNHALIINSQGIESYKKYRPKYSWGYSHFAKESFDDDLMLMECPYCFGMTYYNWDKIENKCQHCHQYFVEEDLYV